MTRQFARVLALCFCVLAMGACAPLGPATDTPRISNSGPITVGPSPSAEWSQLRRDLRSPETNGPEDCPVGEAHVLSDKFAPGFGRGPVYAVGPSRAHFTVDPTSRDSHGFYAVKVLWVAEPRFAEQVLVRARATANDGPVEFSGPFRDELRLDWARNQAREGQWLEWPSHTFVQGPGCYFWQVDYLDGSDWISFEVSLATT